MRANRGTAGFSIVVFILTIPLWLTAFVALSRSGLTMLALRNDLARLAALLKRDIDQLILNVTSITWRDHAEGRRL